jgi:hypothetical protein
MSLEHAKNLPLWTHRLTSSAKTVIIYDRGMAFNPLHMIRQIYVWDEEVKRYVERLIKRLIKVGARASYPARR